jgi:hypothetical protein
MTMTRICLLCLSIFAFHPNIRAQQTGKDVQLTFFNKLPPEIDGCGGFYTYDTTSLKKEKYLFVTDLQKLAFMMVDGKKISLKLAGHSLIQKKIYKVTYSGSGYTVILTTTSVRESDEVWLEKGTVEITKGEQKIIIKIHGESGC